MRTRDRARLKERLNGFTWDPRGSVATIFAVALVPVMIAAGVGVDLSRAMSSRSNLQDALDATGLALAHLPASTPQADLEAKARTWLGVNLSDGNMTPPVLTVVKTNGQVVLTATSKVTTTLTAIAGYRELPISASSTVKWGLGKVEVALVLDNTGSMAMNNKLGKLKVAATDLVNTLQSQVVGQPADTLKVGVVPFSTSVRLSSSNTTLDGYEASPWMRGVMPTQYGEDLFVNNGGNKLTNVNRFTLLDNIGQRWGGCVEARPAPFDVQDTAPSSGTPATLFVPYFAPDEPDYRALKKGSWDYYDSYNDYLTDEVDEHDAVTQASANTDFKKWTYLQGYSGKYDDVVDSADLSAGKGPNYGCTMQALVRLTNNMTTVKSKITAMNATGNTNIPIGLMWGWHVLSPNLPFADGVSYTNPDTKKFIVLLTDGDNVYGDSDNPSNSLYSTLGYAWQSRMPGIDLSTADSARTGAMDARLAVLCTNIKNAGITIFAVRIDVAGTAPAALSGCASSPEKFYDIDSSGLSEAFQDIAGSIGRLRIAQ